MDLVNEFGYLNLVIKSGGTKLDYFLLGIGTLSAIASGAPYPLLGILFGQLIDDLNSSTCATTSNEQPLELNVRTKVIYIIYITIANFVLIYVHAGAWSLFGERLVRRLRVRYLEALLSQEVAFLDTFSAGEAASRLDADLQAIQSGTSEKVGLCISSFSYFVTAYIVAFMKSPRLAGMLFSIVPAFALMAAVGNWFAKKFQDRISDSVAKATGIASAALENMIIVHAFGASERLEALFAIQLKVAEVDGVKRSVTSAVQIGLLYLIAYSANALAFWQGSKEIAASIDGGGPTTSVGSVYTVIFILVDASFIITQVAPFLQLFATASAAFQKLLPTLNRKSRIDGAANKNGDILPKIAGSIEFQNVSFSYPSRPDVTVLRDFVLKIPAKRHTAIVGMSGSGKSTLVSLIMRLYDPDSGQVMIDGRDVRSFNPRNLRSYFGVVEQNCKLFDKSILENIAYGLIGSSTNLHVQLQSALLGPSLSVLVEKIRSGIPFDRAFTAVDCDVQTIIKLVQKASNSVNSSSFIENLEYGLATSVGPGGSRLSGGQRQKIVLARALIRDPSILILDEATASLDTASECSIHDETEGLRNSITFISIAHRLSTIQTADNIVVIRGGQVLEEGAFADLVARDGPFNSMVSSQTFKVSDELEHLPEELQTENRPADSLQLMLKGGIKEKAPFLGQDSATNTDEFSEEEPQGKLKKMMSNFLSVLSVARPYRSLIVLGSFAAILVGASHSGEAVLFGYSLGSLSSCFGSDAILSSGSLYGLLFFILAIVEFIANFTSTSALGKVAEKLVYKVRILSLRSLFYQEIQWHESDGRTPSSLLSYISSDASSLSGLTGTVFGTILAIVVHLFAGIIVAHAIAWKIAVVLLAAIPILLGSGYFRLRILSQFQERHRKAFTRSVAIAVEAVHSIKTIHIFGLQDATLCIYKRSLAEPYRATLRNIAYGNFWLAMAYSISNVVYALAYWWGAKQIAAGSYTQTQFFIVLPALLFAAQSCGQMFSLAPDVSKASVAAGRVIDIIQKGGSHQSTSDRSIQEDLEAGLPATEEKFHDKGQGVSVQLENVHFSYPSRPHLEVLRGLNMSASSNSFVAIVGPSGAGKSTIFALLERFYYPSSGRVMIEGREISKSSSVRFRDAIGLVPQECALFDGTIRFNLAMGARSDGEVSQVQIEDACKTANIYEDIMSLPEQYETPCGPAGNQFSGGQLQRLSIARALVRNPRLLLLDESTSALDSESEDLFQDALRKVSNSMTVIAIAHRYRTIYEADMIYFIDDGKCVDKGNHKELFEGNQSYRENATSQMLRA